ncbi:MAG: lipoprotein insertase outer membrane protein LolB [Woeseiaceae bacterium]
MMRRTLLGALTLLALAGCVTRGVQELPLLENWDQRRDVLARLDVWSLRGRIGIKTPEDARSGSLSWDQDKRAFEADIDGPLGIGGVRLVGTPESVTLSGSKIETSTVGDPETELFRQTGLRVPLGGLRYWLLGVPIPDQQADIVFDDAGHAAVIRQAGWTIEYPEYRQWSVNDLPRRIVAQSGATRLTIVVRDWNIVEEFQERAQ